MKLKPFFVFDDSRKTIKVKRIIFKRFKKFSLNVSNIVVVFGGDGFMLETLKRYKKTKKPFYGINAGTYGFLMNKYNIKKLSNNLLRAKLVTIHPLEMIAKTKDNILKRNIAINDVSIFRQSKQTASLKILRNNKIIKKKLVSDGVLVSTPAGSTAYNLSVHGPILNLNSKKLAITPISPFRPRRWKGCIISDKSSVHINNLNINKRPVSAVADNYEVRNVKSVKIFINKKIKFNLLFDSNNTLNKKIKIEQARKEIN